MSENNISNQVLERIKDTKPKPRWQFLLRDYGVWVLGVLSLILCSLSFSVVLFMLTNNDWDIYSEINNNFLKFLLVTLPYFWLVFLLLFLLAAYYNFKNTKQGYKFPFYKVSLLSILASMLIGTFLYNMGVGQAIEDSFNNCVPYYKEVFNARKKIWMRADEGFLAGYIKSIEEDKITIYGIDGNVWELTRSIDFHCPPMILNVGDRLRLTGERKADGIFEVDCILPLRDMRWMHNQTPEPRAERKIMPMRIIR